MKRSFPARAYSVRESAALPMLIYVCMRVGAAVDAVGQGAMHGKGCWAQLGEL